MKHTILLVCLLALSTVLVTTAYWRLYSMRPDYSKFIVVSSSVELVQIISWAGFLLAKFIWIILAIRYRHSVSTITGKNIKLGRGYHYIQYVMYFSVFMGIGWCTTVIDELYMIQDIGVVDQLWRDFLLPITFSGVLVSVLAASLQVMIFLTTVPSKIE